MRSQTRADEAQVWRLKLAAAVIECGTRRGGGPYRLIVSPMSLRAVTAEGVLYEGELPRSSRLLMYTPRPRNAAARPR